jgi:hypothetical protein
MLRIGLRLEPSQLGSSRAAWLLGAYAVCPLFLPEESGLSLDSSPD